MPRLNIKSTGYKVLSGVIASTSILTMFGNSITPIYAEDTSTLTSSLTPTISGDTSGNQVYTIKSNSSCDGSDSLSGTDAQVFATISKEASGTVVCAKSDGFRTEVSGNSDISNYHWVAWYKNSVDEKPDTTNDTGNYKGFKAEKVQKWSSDAEWVAAVKKLNGGAFPEIKDYTYPTDTTTSKLEFWGDIAGYYSILGDPQYKKIHLTAYQQFSYKTRQESVTWEALIDSDDSNGSNGATPSIGDINSSSGGTYTDANGSKYKTTKECISWKTKETPVYGYAYQSCATNGGCYTASTKATARQQCATLYSGGSARCGKAKKVQIQTGTKTEKYCSKYKKVTKKISANMQSSNGLTLSSNNLLGKITKQETSSPFYTGELNYNGTMQKVVTYTYVWATQEAKVAECDIAKGVYATELGTMPRIALKAGSGSNYTIKSSKTTFWNTIPGYWTDKGVLTAENNSSLPYHFESETDGGTGVNNVNLYSVLTTKDKLFTIVHGYPEIPNYPKIPPYVPETCAKVGDKETCSDDNTPPEKTTIDPNDDTLPQAVVEADKSIRLTQSPK